MQTSIIEVKKMKTKFKVVNVVAIQNCGFAIGINKVHYCPYLLYNTEETTTNRYMAIKPPKATHQITRFNKKHDNVRKQISAGSQKKSVHRKEIFEEIHKQASIL